MARKFIFHIGPAKTGTSSLQEVLLQNRGRLLEQGYDYPGFGRHPHMLKIAGHHGIPARLRTHTEVPQGVLENLAALPQDRTFIFSSEDFSNVEAPAIKVLAESLGDAEFEVVYYARRWDHLLPSIWQELIKHGQSLTYLEFLNHHVSAPQASHYLNYSIPLDRWAGVFGRDRIRIFSYDNVIASGSGIVGHFCRQVLGIPLDQDSERQTNKRQSASMTETLRVLNRLVWGSNSPGPRVRYSLTKHIDRVQEELAALQDIHRRYETAARPCAPMLLHHVEKILLKRYASRVENLTGDGLLFQRSPLVPAAFIRPEYLLESPAQDIYRAILNKIGERLVPAA